MNRSDLQADGFQRPGFRPLAFLALCFLAVTVSAPVNLPLGLLCCFLVNNIYGPGYSDTRGGLVLLLATALQTAGFAALSLPSYYFSRRASTAGRRRVIKIVTAIYLGSWFAWMLYILAWMAFTRGDL